jgi:hypothetical protein
MSVFLQLLEAFARLVLSYEFPKVVFIYSVCLTIIRN